MKLAAPGRFSYHAITDRPDWSWPDGRRLAVYIGLNLEHFAFGEGLGARLAAAGTEPDVLNWAWREYGNRVGAWRLLDLLDELKLPCSLLVNSSMYDHAPDLVAAFRARGDEIVAHGRTNSERQDLLGEAAEAALIALTTARITAEEGRRPAGWLSPWIAESRFTSDLLAEAGYGYTLNWGMDDQPVWLGTRSGGRLLAVPYPQELNDIPAIVARLAGGAEFAAMIVDQFDELLEQSTRQPLVMGIAVHAYILGQPYRLRRLRQALRHLLGREDRVWWTTAGAIAAYAAGLPAGRLAE